jgi:hypothetical protein
VSTAACLDLLLRGEFASTRTDPPWRRLLALAGACGVAYGVVMGTYGLRPVQSVYSGIKVPLLVAVATIVCLPNFLVVNLLLGLRDDLATAVRAVFAAQVTVAAALASFAPLTAFHYVSVADYPFAILWNGGAFLLAAGCGQLTLARHYRPLVARNPRHRLARRLWLSLYVFVSIQSAWVLRPFVGDPERATQFFREGAWSNAYVEVARLIWRALGGR